MNSIEMTDEVISALRALARLPIESLGRKGDDYPIFGLDGQYIKIGHVRDARIALALSSQHHSTEAG